MRKFPAAQAKYKGESRKSPPEHAAQGTGWSGIAGNEAPGSILSSGGMVWIGERPSDPTCIPWRPEDTLTQGESHGFPLLPPGLNIRRGKQSEAGPQENEAPGRLRIDFVGQGVG